MPPFRNQRRSAAQCEKRRERRHTLGEPLPEDASTTPADRHAGHTARRYGRRALILGAASAGAGITASLVAVEPARAAPARPLGGSPVLLGKANSAAATTTVNATAGTGIQGSTATDGQSGVAGIDTSTGDSAHGVFGRSHNGTGVYGRTGAADGIGVWGDDASADGAIGVQGVSPTGFGVFGTSDSGVGVVADSLSGIALEVTGVARFSRSGTATVAGTSKAAKNSVTVTGVRLTSSSHVLVTAQTHVAGVGVAAAVPDPAKGSFTIYLTKSVKTHLHIAWFVVG